MPTNIAIVGNLTEDPQVRHTQNGNQIVEVRIASNEGREKTTFWTAKFFGNKAGEIIAQHGKKGSSVMVSGSTEEETWEKDGQKRSKIVCVANNFSFVGGGKQSEGSEKPSGNSGFKGGAKTPNSGRQSNSRNENFENEDIPF